MIRKAESKDINEIADIWLMSMRNAHYGFKDTYWTKQYKSIHHKYSDERSDVVVYEDGGALLGFGAYIRDAGVVRIFVIPGFQKKGIGSALLAYFEEHYDDFLCRCYRTCTPAVSFLENRGYTRIERRNNVDSGQEEYVYRKQTA